MKNPEDFRDPDMIRAYREWKAENPELSRALKNADVTPASFFYDWRKDDLDPKYWGPPVYPWWHWRRWLGRGRND